MQYTFHSEINCTYYTNISEPLLPALSCVNKTMYNPQGQEFSISKCYYKIVSIHQNCKFQYIFIPY